MSRAVAVHGAGIRGGKSSAAGRIATGMAAERSEAAVEELEALAARRLPAAA